MGSGSQSREGKGELERAEGEGVVRGWVGGGVEREQQQRQQCGRDQVQQGGLHWEVLHGDLLVWGHHRRDTGGPAGRGRRCTQWRELHMGGGGLTISHPAPATIAIVVWAVWLGWLPEGTCGCNKGS